LADTLAHPPLDCLAPNAHNRIMITSYRISDAATDRFDKHVLMSGEPMPERAVWLDLLEPTLEEEREVELYLGIDVPTRDEMKGIEPSNILYVEDGASFMSARILCSSDSDLPRLAVVSFILKKGKLATLRYDEPRSFDLFSSRMARPSVCGGTGEQIFSAMMETIIDRAAEILRMIGERIDGVTTEVFDTRSRIARTGKRDFRYILNTLAQEGDRISKVRESMVSIERMLLFFSTRVDSIRGLGTLRSELKTTLRDVQSLEDHATFLNDKIQFLLDAVLGLVSLDQNNIVKIFSVAAVVFMPPTLIASIYGMNFKVMPELLWPGGYPFALLLMACSAAGTYLFFRWRKWL
jgi:magnesium transporter